MAKTGETMDKMGFGTIQIWKLEHEDQWAKQNMGASPWNITEILKMNWNELNK
jgi:hypothetical protein